MCRQLILPYNPVPQGVIGGNQGMQQIHGSTQKSTFLKLTIQINTTFHERNWCRSMFSLWRYITFKKLLNLDHEGAGRVLRTEKEGETKQKRAANSKRGRGFVCWVGVASYAEWLWFHMQSEGYQNTDFFLLSLLFVQNQTLLIWYEKSGILCFGNRSNYFDGIRKRFEKKPEKFRWGQNAS